MDNARETSLNDVSTPTIQSKTATVSRKLKFKKVGDGIPKTLATVSKPSGRLLRPRPAKRSTSPAPATASCETQSDAEVFKCLECHRAFIDKIRLQNHQRLVHGNTTNNASSPVHPPKIVRRDNRKPTPVKQNGITPILPPSKIMSTSVLQLLEVSDCEAYRKDSREIEQQQFQPPPTPSASSSSDNDDEFVTELIQPPRPQAPNDNVAAAPPPRQFPIKRVQFITPGLGRNNASATGGNRVPPIVQPVNSRGHQLQCPLCKDRFFPTKGSYRNHLESHEGLRPFPCPACGWCYENETQLLDHFGSKHSNEAIYKCWGCGKNYKTLRGLQNHKILKNCKSPDPSTSSGNGAGI